MYYFWWKWQSVSINSSTAGFFSQRASNVQLLLVAQTNSRVGMSVTEDPITLIWHRCNNIEVCYWTHWGWVKHIYVTKLTIIGSNNGLSPVRCRTIIWTNVGILTDHYSNVIMDPMAFQITSLTMVYSTVDSGADQRKHQSSASLAFVRRIQRWPVNSPHKWPVTRKMFPFDYVIMVTYIANHQSLSLVTPLLMKIISESFQLWNQIIHGKPCIYFPWLLFNFKNNFIKMYFLMKVTISQHWFKYRWVHLTKSQQCAAFVGSPNKQSGWDVCDWGAHHAHLTSL